MPIGVRITLPGCGRLTLHAVLEIGTIQKVSSAAKQRGGKCRIAHGHVGLLYRFCISETEWGLRIEAVWGRVVAGMARTAGLCNTNYLNAEVFCMLYHHTHCLLSSPPGYACKNSSAVKRGVAIAVVPVRRHRLQSRQICTDAVPVRHSRYRLTLHLRGTGLRPAMRQQSWGSSGRRRLRDVPWARWPAYCTCNSRSL
jgi:hypothetical protein